MARLYDWSDEEVNELFYSYFKVEPMVFLTMSVSDYYCHLSSLIDKLYVKTGAKEMMMTEYEMQEYIVSSFESGKIGIQYVVRYGAAWLRSLPKKYLWRRKKDNTIDRSMKQ